MTSPAQSIRDFDLWRPTVDGALVSVFIGGTTTLAPIFYDAMLTQSAPNPQTLLAMTVEGIGYGRWARPIYISGAYQLTWATGQTGIIPAPITDLQDQDASYATVQASNGSVARRLTDRAADSILVLDQGLITNSASGNAATITAAIGKVAAQGGGDVILPPGTIPFTQLSLTTGVRLRGWGRQATVLTSVIGDKVITIAGPRSGLRFLTLDGISLQAGSIGLYSLDNDQIYLEECEIKRFAIGFWAQGMQRAAFRDTYVSACATNVKLSGDTNASGTVGRGLIQNNRWIGGSIDNATTIGLDMEYVDSELMGNWFQDIKFDTNISAIKMVGARFTNFPGCAWTGNTKNFDVSDFPGVVASFPRDYIQGLHASGTMNGGSVNLSNTSYDVVIEEMDIKGVAFNLTLPTFQLLLRDCVEDSAVTITGDGTKLVRHFSYAHGETDGVTIGSTPVVAWRRTLGHGEICAFTLRIVAQCQSTDDSAAFIVHGAARRPAASLAYKTQSVNFTVGAVLTGATSGAKATIVADSDSGTTGTLKLINVKGTFLANEAITDSSGGAAVVTSGLVGANVSVGTPVITFSLTTAATCSATLVADGGDVEAQVTGISATTYAWTCGVELLSSN